MCNNELCLTTKRWPCYRQDLKVKCLFVPNFLWKSTQNQNVHIFSTSQSFLCNRITDNSLELIPVMEKIQWWRLQEKLQERWIFQLHEVIPWNFFCFFTFRFFGRYCYSVLLPGFSSDFSSVSTQCNFWTSRHRNCWSS